MQNWQTLLVYDFLVTIYTPFACICSHFRAILLEMSDLKGVIHQMSDLTAVICQISDLILDFNQIFCHFLCRGGFSKFCNHFAIQLFSTRLIFSRTKACDREKFIFWSYVITYNESFPVNVLGDFLFNFHSDFKHVQCNVFTTFHGYKSIKMYNQYNKVFNNYDWQLVVPLTALLTLFNVYF